MQVYSFPDLFVVRAISPQLSMHQHPGFGIGVSLSGLPACVAVSGQKECEAHGFLIGPNLTYALKSLPHTEAVIMVMDPVSSWSVIVRGELSNGSGIKKLSHEDAGRGSWRGLADAVSTNSPCAEVRSLALKVLDECFGLEGITRHIDPRLEAVAQHLLQYPQRSHSAARLAADVGLSSSRLMHLLGEDIGVTVRSLVRWNRLKMAWRLLAEGRSFADAAVSAGFSDHAHLSRSFRAIYGLSPSAVLVGPPPARVHICLEGQAERC